MTTIWRLTIKTDAKKDVDPSKFCIEGNILGVGWQIDRDAPLDWKTYENLGTEKYYKRPDRDNGWWPAVNALGNRMKVNDLCWTRARDWDGKYYIGRIEGDWEYRSTKEYRDADIVNVRPCRWFQTGGVDSVPGKVLNSFRAGRTVQAVYDDTSSFYSKHKYNQLSGEAFYDLSGNKRLDLFALISTEDCEDIVGLYLQEKLGYRLIPSSCKKDTPKTEFVLKTVEGKAHAQVKQGYEDLNKDDFEYDPGDPCEWFLFTSNGQYLGRGHDHLHCLNPDDMREFALSNRDLMSSRVQTAIDFLRQV